MRCPRRPSRSAHGSAFSSGRGACADGGARRCATLAAMSKREASPLPQRDGLDAVRIVLPPAGPWRTVREYLHVRLSRLEPERIDAMLSQGRFVTADGPAAAESPYRPGLSVWFHRE